jgi:hypothetical protein
MPYESYRGVSNHRPLTTTEKGLIVAGSTLVGGPASIIWGGGRLALALWKLRPFTIPFLFPSPSPGGGGPGQFPISTDSPPSMREQGRASAEPGTYGRTPSPSVGKESRASRSRKRCPPGYRWNGQRCVRKG